ncbi:Mannose-1-phosphate guanylyltransferase [Denitrovibrio acetiphilus DSM 12809]|uniref:Mannose-1-phosphate guanylyltransferase n=2 Tax=Denitrovibrio TaxID=117999 RepID=D4H594_DENA2|nr:Mannose-1-phosphate guanylyltransferase [Denitrovibrio acetiphilus DSM 12809]
MLWPLSAGDTPKQFIQFGTEDSLYIKTIKRNNVLCDKADDQLRKAKLSADIVMEPSCKGTAASIMIACFMYPNETFLLTPSDHEISDEKAYAEAVQKAQKLAEKGNIVLFGIEPERAEHRFGYIKDGKTVQFVEKPDAEKAQELVDDGWLVNSGILCFNSSVMMHELVQFPPDQSIIARTVYENIRSGRATHRLCGRFMGEMKKHDIDKSVLERTTKLKCVKGITGWRDVGTYESIYEFRNRKEGGNLSINIGDSFGCADFVDSSGCMVLNNEQDVVVVQTGGKVLVAHKDTDIMQAMKKLEEY